jgi:hypothetical protein
MLFRPEEMNTASGVRPVLRPLTQRNINISTYANWGFVLNNTITHNNLKGFTTIQARCIDLNSLSLKYPADRQGFKASLSKPFLLSFNSNTVLRR